LIYAEALNNAGDSQLASDALVSQINEEWDERLIELYGKLPHSDAISAGEKDTGISSVVSFGYQTRIKPLT